MQLGPSRAARAAAALGSKVNVLSDEISRELADARKYNKELEARMRELERRLDDQIRATQNVTKPPTVQFDPVLQVRAVPTEEVASVPPSQRDCDSDGESKASHALSDVLRRVEAIEMRSKRPRVIDGRYEISGGWRGITLGDLDDVHIRFVNINPTEWVTNVEIRMSNVTGTMSTRVISPKVIEDACDGSWRVKLIDDEFGDVYRSLTLGLYVALTIASLGDTGGYYSFPVRLMVVQSDDAGLATDEA